MGLRSDVAVVVVGAGQAGLATAYELMRGGLRPQEDFVLVDARDPDTLAWRQRWDSLRLFTPAWYSHLPGVPMPGDPNRHPLAHEVGEYLDAYRESLGVQPRWGVRALGVTVEPQGLVLRTTGEDIRASAIIAATGPFSLPSYPLFAESVVVAGATLHSDQYRRPSQMPGGPVLVVGSGNTGLQIARELAATHCVSIARGSRQLRLPQRFLGLDIFRWLKLTGALTVPATSLLGRRMSRTETIIGSGLGSLAPSGVHVLPRAVGASGDVVSFEGGEERHFDSIIWATGYRTGYEWLPRQALADRTALRDGGTAVDGIYLIGAPWMRNRASALIGGVGADAERVVAAVRRQLGDAGKIGSAR